MRTQVLVLLGAAAAGLTQDINATVVTWNPPDACYIARLEGAINVRARASSDVFGLGFNFHVSLDGLPEDQDPFGTSARLTVHCPFPCLVSLSNIAPLNYIGRMWGLCHRRRLLSQREPRSGGR